MATMRTLEPIKRVLKTKTKVAAYARVSKDSENLIRSFANQVKYYTDFIKSNPEWDFVEVYSDEYISGTRIFNRPGFNRMVEDAKAGKFEILLVKSISRFSRNTVDCLKVIRMLSEIGVEIRFEKESINTASGEKSYISLHILPLITICFKSITALISFKKLTPIIPSISKP